MKSICVNIGKMICLSVGLIACVFNTINFSQEYQNFSQTDLFDCFPFLDVFECLLYKSFLGI